MATKSEGKTETKRQTATNLVESSYLICTLLMDTFRLPIIVAIIEPSHEFPGGG